MNHQMRIGERKTNQSILVSCNLYAPFNWCLNSKVHGVKKFLNQRMVVETLGMGTIGISLQNPVSHSLPSNFGGLSMGREGVRSMKGNQERILNYMLAIIRERDMHGQIGGSASQLVKCTMCTTVKTSSYRHCWQSKLCVNLVGKIKRNIY